ncbi:MAG: hypothetical protein KBB55_01440, partial [Candidatus Buchananbacteria bacterium]|nr:hypothetical protein [Candidatus Buchananbacteria bacterium]
MSASNSNIAESTLSTYSSWNLLCDMYRLIKPYRWRFVVASLVRALGDIVNLYPAYALASTVTILA